MPLAFTYNIAHHRTKTSNRNLTADAFDSLLKSANDIWFEGTGQMIESLLSSTATAPTPPIMPHQDILGQQSDGGVPTPCCVPITATGPCLE